MRLVVLLAFASACLIDAAMGRGPVQRWSIDGSAI